MTPESFVLHFRITKSCNANCSYCSSAMVEKLDAMTPFEARQSALNVIKYWEQVGVSPKYLTIEYVGGEVTMLPLEKLTEIVTSVRDVFSAHGVNVHDGVQSNLIAPKRKLEALYELFDGRMGTSIDNFTSQRKIGSSSTRYRKKLNESLEHFHSIKGKILPAVLTIDANNKAFISDEYKIANQDGRDLVIRPVFQGGSTVELVSQKELLGIYTNVFEEWFMKGNISVEPLSSLLKKRIDTLNGKSEQGNYCSWQSDCIRNSLSIEPNGDAFVCQELADHDFGLLGNTITGEYDHAIMRKLGRRSVKIAKQCGNCTYFNDCQGGCMMHAIEKGLTEYDKTPYCETWKALFSLLDININKHSATEISNWMTSNEKQS
ncbi:SPASM domain-containing protein [Vibrio splendidus]|nr:SPASM domain-containing protein [Vibrio splendidus]MCC4883232.1 SPASM domain-containing protein [Vibrio splendidus]